MKRRNIIVLKALAVVLTLLFILFNSFDLVEIWFKSHFPDLLNPIGSLEYRGAIKSVFLETLIVGGIGIISALLSRRFFKIIGVIIGLCGVFYGLRVPFYSFWGDGLFGSFGGLGYNVYKITVFGYAVLILSHLILALQIVLLLLERKPRKEKQKINFL